MWSNNALDHDDIIDVVDILRPEDEVRFNQGLMISLALSNVTEIQSKHM